MVHETLQDFTLLASNIKLPYMLIVLHLIKNRTARLQPQ